MSLGDQRHLFEVDDDVAYFNTAALSPLLRSAREAGEDAVAQRSRPWEFTAATWFEDSERLRNTFARLVNATPEHIALVPGASYGLAVAARNLPLRPGQRVVVLDQEFPSSYYTWRRATDRAGVELQVVAPEPGQSWTDAVLGAVDERSAVVQVPNVHWTNGAWLDLPRIRQRTTEVGAALVIDASQSLGAVPFDLAELRPDALVVVGYKWLLGAYSLGYLYLDERYWDGEALEQNWIARAGSDRFATLVDYTEEYQPGARRFDVGERSNFGLVPVGQAGLDQLLEWGVANVAEALGAITADITAQVGKLGLTVPHAEARGPHLFGVQFPPGTVERVGRALEERRVFASVRGPSLRIAPHLHVSAGDVERLVDALASAL